MYTSPLEILKLHVYPHIFLSKKLLLQTPLGLYYGPWLIQVYTRFVFKSHSRIFQMHQAPTWVDLIPAEPIKLSGVIRGLVFKWRHSQSVVLAYIQQ
jgi:hypothetical protein